jgi:hypothetical protein
MVGLAQAKPTIVFLNLRFKPQLLMVVASVRHFQHHNAADN